jgi:hypothetical protein
MGSIRMEKGCHPGNQIEMKGEIHEKLENVSQSSRENWLYPTVAVRRSDSYFGCDLSAAWLHVIGAKPLKVKSWLMTTKKGNIRKNIGGIERLLHF